MGQFITALVKMMKWVIIATFLATNVLSKSFLIETASDEEDNRRRGIDDTVGPLELGEDYHNSGLPCNAAQGFDPLACLDAAGQLPQTTTSLSAQIPGYIILDRN